MRTNQSFPVADLSHQELNEIKQLEKQLRNESGEEIVLIAYEQKFSTNK
jgi:hypothetical protein